MVCNATGSVCLFMGNSVPSIMIVVDGYFWLKSIGKKCGKNHSKATNFVVSIWQAMKLTHVTNMFVIVASHTSQLKIGFILPKLHNTDLDDNDNVLLTPMIIIHVQYDVHQYISHSFQVLCKNIFQEHHLQSSCTES